MDQQGQFQSGNVAPEKKVSFFDAVSNASPEQLDVETVKSGDVQMNVVNAVNANGIVSGRKVVDFIWQRIAICAMIIALGCAIAVVVMISIASESNNNAYRQEVERKATDSKLNDLYAALNVDGQQKALESISRSELISGADIAQIFTLVQQKYGTATQIDISDVSQNFVSVSGIYKIASLKINDGENSRRVYAYARYTDSQWKMMTYDENSDTYPCAEFTDEDKQILSGLVKCPEIVEEDSEE